MKRQKTTFVLMGILLSLSITSCVSVRSVGSLNSVSTRNIETSKEYEFKMKTPELSKKQIRKEGGGSIQSAIDIAVAKDPSGKGEYLMNARIFLVRKDYIFIVYSRYIAEGDIWGVK